MKTSSKILTRDPGLSALMHQMNQMADGIDHEHPEAAVTLFQFFETFPLPVRIATTSGEVIRVNRTFRRDYCNDDESHDECCTKGAVSEAGIIQDIRASNHGGPLVMTEAIINPRSGQEEVYIVVRWPLEVEIVDDKGVHWTEAMGSCYLMLVGGGEHYGFRV